LASYFAVLITLVCPVLCGLDADRAESGRACPVDASAPVPGCGEGAPVAPDGAPCSGQSCLCSPYVLHLPKPGQPAGEPDLAQPPHAGERVAGSAAFLPARAALLDVGRHLADAHCQPGHALPLLI
jgi:hypothetical protein